MKTYANIKEFVDRSFVGQQTDHFLRTVYWLEQFMPQTSEAHWVAAYAHDIERAFRDNSSPLPTNYLDHEFLRHHQEKGAEIMREFLLSEPVSEDFIHTVTHLIARHEEGGDAEQNALMDADSVSFFETNAEMFVTKKAPVEGYEKIRTKFDWMFDRISSAEAKRAAKLHYDHWMRELTSPSQSR